jgi:cell division GTPase FtsZ
VIGISDIIVKPGLINVDFADVRSVMGGAGTALMGIGRGRYACTHCIYTILRIHVYTASQ